MSECPISTNDQPSRKGKRDSLTEMLQKTFSDIINVDFLCKKNKKPSQMTIQI
jgi:hypothetical protein